MKVVAAYLLAGLGGNTSKECVKEILASVGADADEESLDSFYKMIAGKDVNELLQLGSQKFASGGGGGGAAMATGAGGGGGAAAAAPAAEEEKKEEKKEEKEESDDDMGFSLFD